MIHFSILQNLSYEIKFQNQSTKSGKDVTSIKSLLTNSYEGTEFIIEKEEFKYAAKLHRDCGLLENSNIFHKFLSNTKVNTLIEI